MTATVDVLTSGIWQLNSVVLAQGGDCAVVDPGYFPRELEDLRRLALQRGRPRAVVFTHGHWDHVVGWSAFPEADVFASEALASAVAGSTPEAERNLAQAVDFDGRWYIERPTPLRWPPKPRALLDGARVPVGNDALEVLLLPGHSRDGLGLLLGSQGLLLAGDYLSACEIPFVQDLAAYRQTLLRLKALLEQGVEVIPGHGPRLTAARARAVLDGDLEYLERLARFAETGDVVGARRMPWPRAKGVPGMQEHHLENCAAAGLAEEMEGEKEAPGGIVQRTPSPDA